LSWEEISRCKGEGGNDTLVNERVPKNDDQGLKRKSLDGRKTGEKADKQRGKRQQRKKGRRTKKGKEGRAGN